MFTPLNRYGRLERRKTFAKLTRRCIEAEADLQAEIGDIAEHIRGKLKAANTAESDRRT